MRLCCSTVCLSARPLSSLFLSTWRPGRYWLESPRRRTEKMQRGAVRGSEGDRAGHCQALLSSYQSDGAEYWLQRLPQSSSQIPSGSAEIKELDISLLSAMTDKSSRSLLGLTICREEKVVIFLWDGNSDIYNTRITREKDGKKPTV